MSLVEDMTQSTIPLTSLRPFARPVPAKSCGKPLRGRGSASPPEIGAEAYAGARSCARTSLVHNILTLGGVGFEPTIFWV